MDKAKLKKRAVEEKGGCCLLCGYKRCLAALDFHHINPHMKDFNISSKTSWEEIEQELDKCVLLCKVCHVETHAGLVDIELFVELEI